MVTTQSDKIYKITRRNALFYKFCLTGKYLRTVLLHYLSLISYIHSNTDYKQDNILSFFCSESETLESVPFIFFIEKYENSSQEGENVLSPVIDE